MTPGHRVPRARLAIAVVATGLFAPTGLAQLDGLEPGPQVVSPRAELKWISFTDLDIALEFEWRRDVDAVDPAGVPRRRDREDRFREILEASTVGFIGHPNLLRLDLSGRFRLTQRKLDLDTTTFTGNSDEFLLDWDIRGLFFQTTKSPATIYSFQTTNDINRQFGGSLENTVRETGVRVNLRSDSLPTNITVFRRKQEQVDRTLAQDFNIDQYSLQADGLINLGPGHRMNWDLTYDDVDESGELLVARSFKRLEGNAIHTYNFGLKEASQIRSTLRVFDQSGDRNFRQFRLNEVLRLRHDDNLTSWYDYTFERLDNPGQEQIRNNVLAHFRHRLFESVITTGRAGINFLDVPTDSFDSTEIFGEVNSDYVKKVGPGRILARAGVILNRLDQAERGSPLQINDQPFVFSASGLIVINQENVVTSSIVITDVTGVITYSEGPDYSVLGLPDRVEIRRVPGGAIAAGQAVLVDFTIGPEPGGTTDTNGYSVDLRYTFDDTFLRGLSVYGRYIRQDQRRSAELTAQGFPDNDFTDLLYGVEYNAWKVYFRAEQQQRDSTVSPFDSTRVEGRYVDQWARGSSFTLSAIYQEIDRKDVDIRTATTTFSGLWSQQITTRLSADLLLQWQIGDDSVGGDFEAFETQLDVRWRYRQTEVYGKVRASFNNSDPNDINAQTYIIGIRREF